MLFFRNMTLYSRVGTSTDVSCKTSSLSCQEMSLILSSRTHSDDSKNGGWITSCPFPQ